MTLASTVALSPASSPLTHSQDHWQSENLRPVLLTISWQRTALGRLGTRAVPLLHPRREGRQRPLLFPLFLIVFWFWNWVSSAPFHFPSWTKSSVSLQSGSEHTPIPSTNIPIRDTLYLSGLWDCLSVVLGKGLLGTRWPGELVGHVTVTASLLGGQGLSPWLRAPHVWASCCGLPACFQEVV